MNRVRFLLQHPVKFGNALGFDKLGVFCIEMRNTLRHLSEAQPHRKKVVCTETGEIFESFADAARKTGLNRTKIVSCCTGKRKTTGGYHFRYVDEKTGD